MRNEAVKQAVELLERGVNDVFESGRLEEYLDVMSRFHGYSARNCMLIMMQRPDATRVAGYKAWKRDFNRQVRKGERSISILAPIPHKSIIRETNRETGEVTDHEHVWNSFRVVHVFDISQTDGDDLPEIATDLTADVDCFAELCAKVESATTATVQWGVDFPDPDCHGSFNKLENVIRIRGGMSEAQTFKTLVHETAHSLLHCIDGEQYEVKRHIREVQAEGVAYVVCKALGVDAGDYSFGYVASWSNDPKEVIGELDVIRRTANAILDKVA